MKIEIIDVNGKLKDKIHSFMSGFVVKKNYGWNGNDINISKDDDVKFKVGKEVFEYDEFMKWSYENENRRRIIHLAERDVALATVKINSINIDFWYICSDDNDDFIPFRVCSYSSKKYTENIIVSEAAKFIETIKQINVESAPQVEVLSNEIIESAYQLGDFVILEYNNMFCIVTKKLTTYYVRFQSLLNAQNQVYVMQNRDYKY